MAKIILQILGSAMFVLASAAFGGEHTNLLSPAPPMPHCGEIESPPFADSTDAGSRKCPPTTARNYKPRHKGLGFEILDSESEACFVPDQEHELLDQLIDAVTRTVHYDPT